MENNPENAMETPPQGIQALETPKPEKPKPPKITRENWREMGAKAPPGRPRKNPLPAAPPENQENPPAATRIPKGAKPTGETPKSPDEAAAFIADTLHQNAASSTGAARAEPIAAVDAVEGGEAAGEEEAGGVPAGEVLAIAVESIDNLVAHVDGDYAMTPREKGTMTKAAALMPTGNTLPWWLGAVIAGGSWMLRVYLMLRARQAAKDAARTAAAQPATQGPAQEVPAQSTGGIWG